VSRRGVTGILRRAALPKQVGRPAGALREAALLGLLNGTAARAPRLLLACEDAAVIGAPFYVMEELGGTVMNGPIPLARDDSVGRRALVGELVDALVDIHALDISQPGFAAIGRPSGFLDRQLRRWSDVWSAQRTRELPVLEAITAWLRGNRPAPPGPPTLMHGDYRLGNIVLEPTRSTHLIGILDWEVATIGDPLCDLAWLLTTWPDEREPSALLSILGGMEHTDLPSRAEVTALYARRSGRSVASLPWYSVFVLWRAAIALETLREPRIPGRVDPLGLQLEVGVPELVCRAASVISEAPG
jgi:aminoglycoside phosphotransferase (APT) family kinase protein